MAHNINPSLTPTPITAVHEDPKNARRHPPRNLEAIKASLHGLGQQKPIVVNDKGMIIAGNGTFRAAVALGWDHIATVPFMGDAKAARLFAIADNRTAELAEWDVAGLQDTLHDVGEADWATAGWTTDELRDTTGTLPSAGAPTPDSGPSLDIDGKASRGPTLDDKAVSFMNAALRQITLVFKAEDHTRVVAALEEVCKDQGLDSNTDAVEWLLAEYAAGKAQGGADE